MDEKKWYSPYNAVYSVLQFNIARAPSGKGYLGMLVIQKYETRKGFNIDINDRGGQ